MKTNNQKFQDINIEKQIYKYMLTEPINYSKHLIPAEFEDHANVLSQKKENEAKQKKFLIEQQQLMLIEQIKKLKSGEEQNISERDYLETLRLVLSKPNLVRIFKENHK